MLLLLATPPHLSANRLAAFPFGDPLCHCQVLDFCCSSTSIASRPPTNRAVIPTNAGFVRARISWDLEGRLLSLCRCIACAENMSWELSLLTLIVSVFSIWTIRSSNTTSAVLKAIGVVFCALAFYPDPVLLIQHLSSTAFQGWNDIRFDVLLVTHFRMVLTLGAVVW